MVHPHTEEYMMWRQIDKHGMAYKTCIEARGAPYSRRRCWTLVAQSNLGLGSGTVLGVISIWASQ